MKILKTLMVLSLVSILACDKKSDISDEQINQIQKEIEQLFTFEEKKIYLEKILEDDQNVRDDSDLVLQHGLDSPEYIEFINAQWKQDEINLVKVETYLEIHGYPSKEIGDMATTAPWMVIHHAQGYEARERNFKVIYEAYLKDDITDGAISFYLGRMYDIKYGERLKMKSPYKPEDEINLLINKLNLKKKKILKKKIEK
jgi:coenzyme F420-reducing hydrogenase alpha subunit